MPGRAKKEYNNLMPKNIKPRSSLHFLLSALMPYSKANLQLSFKPGQFFHELEQLSGYANSTLKNTIRKAEREGLIEREGRLIRITDEGRASLKPFKAERLKRRVSLMVIFDVPEERSSDRRRFRLMLKEWHFRQEQQSVWISSFDYKKSLVKAVKEMNLEACVEIYECSKLYPK